MTKCLLSVWVDVFILIYVLYFCLVVMITPRQPGTQAHVYMYYPMRILMILPS